MELLPQLGVPALQGLADAIETGRLSHPFSLGELARHVPSDSLHEVATALNGLPIEGVGPRGIVRVLRAIADERRRAQRIADRVELVWSGPELVGARTRETSVVVRELFLGARKTILISAYAIDFGERGRTLFRPLAERMDGELELEVRMFLNVARPHGSQESSEEIVRAFADRFRSDAWPGVRLPRVFHDPRALEQGMGPKSCLHAKCIIADGVRAFIGSANLTEAAQERNIEAGILVEDTVVAGALRAQFEGLAAAKHFVEVPGLGA